METTRLSGPAFTALVLSLILVIPAPVGAQESKNHITIAAGYQKFTDDRLEGGATWPDMTKATYVSFAYRRSVSSQVDITFDFRTMESRGTFSTTNMQGWKWLMSAGLLGPGVRYTFARGPVRPYAQGNLFLSATGGDQPPSYFEASGVGVGLSAGTDIRLSRLLSIPVEVNYVPIDYVSGGGVNAGLAFNW